MKSVEQPLYLKLSSIYNKILQLVSAILLIVALIAVWLSSVEKSQETLSQHFEQMAQQFLQQAVAGASALLDESEAKITKNIRYALLQKYINKMAKAKVVRDIHVYDETGMLLLSSEHQQYSPLSITALFGIEQTEKSSDLSEQYLPFIGEIRHEQLKGYLRITIEKALLISALKKERHDRWVFYSVLLMFAGVVGILLTKALRPFSKQDYKPRMTKDQQQKTAA